jgi:hypothetical protein
VVLQHFIFHDRNKKCFKLRFKEKNEAERAMVRIRSWLEIKLSGVYAGYEDKDGVVQEWRINVEYEGAVLPLRKIATVVGEL